MAVNKDFKILVVDDTIFYRKLLSNIIEEIPDVDLKGVASNGKIALQKIELSPPDLVLMDVIMPKMDGLEALKRIKANHPGVNVVMVSGIDKEAAAMTVKALEAGALDFISKPKAVSPDAAIKELKSALIPLINLSKTLKYSLEVSRISKNKKSAVTINKTVDEPRVIPRPSVVHKPTQKILLQASPTGLIYSAEATGLADSAGLADSTKFTDSTGHARADRTARTVRSEEKRSIGKIDVVALGVSTGGPNALKRIIPKISKDLPVPIIAVQHMPPVFTASLAESLNNISQIKVVEGKAEQIVEKGVMYIAPGGCHMVVRKAGDAGFKLGLVDTQPVHNCRPAVDVLFRSIGMVYGGNVLTVILTGMGNDGMSGVAAIRRKGGYSLIQDEKTSVVWGMPGSVAEANEADEIRADDEIADRIMEIVKKGRS